MVTGCSLTKGSGSLARFPRSTALCTALISIPRALRPPLQLPPACRIAANPLEELPAVVPTKIEALLAPQHGRLENFESMAGVELELLAFGYMMGFKRREEVIWRSELIGFPLAPPYSPALFESVALSLSGLAPPPQTI